MAPGQNTFSIIPNAPGAINSNVDAAESRLAKRPMTTKQAKKAYQKANKGPKLSKAEQRRRELLEQDRIRREFEKEKNQARAKAARDRKKEKEEKERAEKKKKGLPLVDVHPSQDTIAWFVRGHGRKQEKEKSPAVGLSVVNKDDNSSCTLSDEDASERPPKRQKTNSPVPANLDPQHSPSATGMIDSSMSAAHDLGVGDAPPDLDDLAEGHSAREHIDVDIDDTETIEPLPDELFDELVNATNSPPQHKEIVPNEDASPPRDQRSPHSPPIPKPSENHSHLPTLTKELTLEQKTEDSASLPSTQRPLQPLSTHEVNSRAMNTPKEPGPDLTKPIAPTDVPTIGSPAETVSRVQQPVSATRSFRHPKTPMGPPPVPPKFKPRSHIQTKESRTPPFLLKQTHTPNPHLASKPHPNHAEGRILQQIRQECPPTSTQLFMLGHLDDFFPSPSQEVRELFGESNISIGAHDSKVNPRAANPTRAPTTSAPTARNSPAKSISIVPDFNRPSLAVKNGTAKCDPIQASKPPVQARTSPSLFTANAQSSGNPDGFDMPFFSTQDLVFSSQDMRDLEDDAASPLGSKHRESSHQSKNMPEQQNSFSCGAARDDTSADPTTSIPLPPSKKAKYTDSSSKTESTINNGLLSHPRLLTKSREYPESSTPISKNTASLRTQVGKDGVHNPGRNEARPLKNDEKGMPSAVERNHQINNHTLQAKKDAMAPRGSPKPFFASSGREADYKYAIERTKTTAWEGISTRQKAREELEHLQKSEDERLEKLLLEGLREDGSMRAHGICASTSGSRHRDSAPRPQNQAKGLSQPRSINQLSSSAGRSTQSEKMNEPNERRPRQNQSRSSYKEMLELLKQKENQRQEQKAVPASQETDYGDAGLDDVLSEML